MRGISVLVAGAGLAGLTAARELGRKGRSRHRHRRARSRRRPRLHGSRAIPPRRACRSRRRSHRRKPDGNLQADRRRWIAHGEDSAWRLHIGPARSAGGAALAASTRWQDLGKRLQPEVRAFCVSEQRWDGGVAASLARESVAQWLDRIRAPQGLRDVAVGLRGFFLADPDELSLLALADQFAEDGAPGSEKMFRIIGGNDRLPAVLAKALGSRLRLQTILRRVTQTRDGVTAALESKGRVNEARFDYLVCAMPATTVRDVVFEPALPEIQRQAMTSRQVRRRDEDRAAVRSRAVAQARQASSVRHAVSDWRRLGWKRGAATGRILTLLAGGGASAATREMLAAEGPSRIVRELSWLNLKNTELIAWTSVSWEHEPWSRGGYAFFDTAVSAVAALLARATVRSRLLRRRAHEPAMAGLHERRGGDGIARSGRSGAGA